ncbi:hypothetical protein Rmet_4231 (plasmid) [Cupriavidus metallidurans CH34]|uniref:Uncharacterized protein n=1 Tax=Cupriavidus metallidurans (strain ATCC 43123 / DSM 2839 / NBRC 102507 / CH34) TaxID=266264 RepID=Q1LFH8_CUPMC|nr:hypothetical protein Rmet_4231 [Cupriavidus metallidurans CH34]
MAVSLSLFFSNIARYWNRPKFDYKKRICVAMVRRVVKLAGHLTRQCGRASPLQEKGAPRKQPLMNPSQIMGKCRHLSNTKHSIDHSKTSNGFVENYFQNEDRKE